MYACALCAARDINKNQIRRHVVHQHGMTLANYYLEFIARTAHPPQCKNPLCENELFFRGLTLGYPEHCSMNCAALSRTKRAHYERRSRARPKEPIWLHSAA